MARRFVSNFFTFVIWDGAVAFFFRVICTNWKTATGMCFQKIRLRTKTCIQFPFSFSFFMCELSSLIISDAVGLSLHISILRTAAHEVGLGQILLEWTGLFWLRNDNELSNSMKWGEFLERLCYLKLVSQVAGIRSLSPLSWGSGFESWTRNCRAGSCSYSIQQYSVTVP